MSSISTKISTLSPKSKQVTRFSTISNAIRSVYNRSESNSENDFEFEPFLSMSWDIYSVSPLYRLDYSDIYLKRCAKWMREQIVNFVSDSKRNLQYTVEFTMLKAFQITEYDDDSLKVKIITVSNERTSILYEGIFISRGRESNENISSSFKYLPTLICRCSKYTATIVHGLIQRLFDCKICQIYLDTCEFKWLNAVFCTDSFNKKTSVELVYNIQDKNTLQFSMPLASVAKIWESIHDNGSKTIHIEEVEEFHKVLDDIIIKMFRIDVQKFTFKRIKMSSFSVEFPCKIKINDSQLFSEFLLFINDITDIFKS